MFGSLVLREPPLALRLHLPTFRRTRELGRRTVRRGAVAGHDGGEVAVSNRMGQSTGVGSVSDSMIIGPRFLQPIRCRLRLLDPLAIFPAHIVEQPAVRGSQYVLPTGLLGIS